MHLGNVACGAQVKPLLILAPDRPENNRHAGPRLTVRRHATALALERHVFFPQILWATLCITLLKSPASRTGNGLPGCAFLIIGRLVCKAYKRLVCFSKPVFSGALKRLGCFSLYQAANWILPPDSVRYLVDNNVHNSQTPHRRWLCGPCPAIEQPGRWLATGAFNSSRHVTIFFKLPGAAVGTCPWALSAVGSSFLAMPWKRP
jgi:hypothetical protein